MRITAKADYAVRATCELAARAGQGPVKGDVIAAAQGIPLKFLENILGEMKKSGILASQRGAVGGYWLAKPAAEITVADVIRAVEGPLADVRGQRPEVLAFEGAAESLRDVWLAVRVNLRSVLERVTVADVAGRDLPAFVADLLAEPDAFVPH
jgi:Rrf2 family protein